MAISKKRKLKAIGLNEISEEDIQLTIPIDDVCEILEFQPWFDYELAKKIIRKLGRMYEEARIDKEIRPLSYFICSDINNGKTTLVTRFRNIMERRQDYKDGDIIYYEIPVRATLKQVFANVLAKLGKPITGTALRNTHTQELVNLIIKELEQRKVKLLFIDELQDLVVASSEDKREIFKGFKKILNNCSTRLVLIGTIKAKELLYLDDWIDERLMVIELPKWKDGVDFRKIILAIFKAYSPFVPNWDLVKIKEDKKVEFNYPIIKLLETISQGRLGKLLQIIRYAIIEALEEGEENVLERHYKDIFDQEIKYEVKKGKLVKTTKKNRLKEKNSKK